MKPKPALLAALCALPLVACINHTTRQGLEIGGELSKDEKIEAAKSVADELNSSGFIEKARARFPNIDPLDESHFGVQWRYRTYYKLGGDKEETRVQLICLYRAPRRPDEAPELMAWCVEQLREQLKKRNVPVREPEEKKSGS